MDYSFKNCKNGVIMKNILYLVLFNKDKRKTFTKYFETEFEMDKFIRRMYFFKNLILIEDSRDIYFFGKD